MHCQHTKETKLNFTDWLAEHLYKQFDYHELGDKMKRSLLNAGQTPFTQLLKIFHDINILKIHIQNVMTSLLQVNTRIQHGIALAEISI